MIISALKDLIFPPKCILCNSLLVRSEVDLCKSCREETDYYPYGASTPYPGKKSEAGFLDSINAVWYYEGSVRSSILRYKFRNKVSLAAGFGRMLAMKILKEDIAFDVLTWVPVSKLRKFRRGYDQCELLAKTVGRELGVKPVRVLKKVRNTPAQSGIADASKRKANASGAYKAVSADRIRGKRVLLLDDVYTTGATANECARVLLLSGASSVHCAVIASASKAKNLNSR